MILAANSQPDSSFEVTFAEDFAVSESATATVALPASLSVARIDEAGLRAMARRAREQDQGWAADGIGPARSEMPIANSPLDLFVPATSESLVIPHSRRSA